ncbi:glycosyl hydrolase family 18 protein [Kiloniella antarctica]|uniref:chitinase n=1 Tax=Kiloniella antarctica TaxID=1550907 RepID=A0ABW5BIV3_9PROT
MSATTFAQTRFIIYYNSEATPLSEAVESEYSHVIVSFLGARINASGQIALILPRNMEEQWSSVPLLQAKGKKVLISFGGGLAKTKDYQVLVGREGELAGLISEFVRTRKLDGVDIDFEASPMLHIERPADVADGKAFLVTLTKALRKQLPVGKYSLSHAPQSPYLNTDWHGGPYLDVLKEAGDEIDWITVQYYNNPGQDGPIKDKVVGKVTDPYKTSYRGLVAMGNVLAWPPEKLVIGKPVYKADAFSGHVAPEIMIQDIIRPLVDQYGDQFGGIAGWQYSIHTEDHRQWNDNLGKALYQIK